MKLKTLNIFLDTSIFEENNFLQGRKINSLIKHAEEGTIKLYSSGLAITELKERVRKKVQLAKSEIRKFRNQKPKPVEVFRNTQTYESFDKIWDIDYEEEISSICKKIDEVVQNTPITLLSTEGISIEGVFEKYYKEEAPFKEGNKKHEFPDAFILATIENWCKKENEKIITVSNDKDWLDYNCEDFIKLDSLELYYIFVLDIIYNRVYMFNMFPNIRIFILRIRLFNRV